MNKSFIISFGITLHLLTNINNLRTFRLLIQTHLMSTISVIKMYLTKKRKFHHVYKKKQFNH